MKAIAQPVSRRPGVVAVHSVDRFVFTVPDLQVAEKFYAAFGLDVRPSGTGAGARLDLYTFGHPHCWASVLQAGERKQLQYFSFGIYAQDEPVFRQRIAERGIGIAPHPLGDGKGLWLRDPDGTAVQLVVAGKVSPSAPSPASPVPPVPPGQGAAPSRSKVAPVHPRYLSHILKFTPDVTAQVAFCTSFLGLRLSDHSGDIIAFTHTPHGSDHHLLAFAKSHAPGLHHSSWDVGSADEVGKGMEQMRNAGWGKGWGVGRHVLGSNFFNSGCSAEPQQGGARASALPVAYSEIHARRDGAGGVLHIVPGPAPVGPLWRHHRFYPYAARQRPPPSGLRQIPRAGPAPQQLGRGQR